jgi:hypothetical protein
MIHPILDQHEAIAWDMDQTLVDGPNSAFFLDYITHTPHKRHHVVTFRNKSWANTAWAELRELGLDSAKLIRSVENCPEPIHDCFMIDKKFAGRDERHRYYNGPALTREEFDTNSSLFPLWKAERAKQIGCTILVDDMPQWVKAGCDLHGVQFLHAFDAVPEAAQSR